jgi:Chaperone of endosialidase
MLRTILHGLRFALPGAGAAALVLVAVGGADNGGNFILGQSNSAANTTALAAPVPGGKALQVTNTNTTSGSTALGLNVASGHAPFTVNTGVKVTSLNADLLDGLDSTALPYWKLGGNTGTTPGTNFLGTSDNKALELKVNGKRALRLEPNSTGPNLIGGFSGNAAQSGAHGATVAGGGQAGDPNLVSEHFGTVGGGAGNRASSADDDPTTATYATVAGGFDNTASGSYSAIGGGGSNITFSTGAFSAIAGGSYNTASGANSTVAGGYANAASGVLSFAAGRRAKATHFGSFVWADVQSFDIGSYGNNTFTARTTGGARFISAIDGVTGAPTAGVTLAAGGGSWSSLSDRAAKRGFSPVDRSRLLERLDRVPIARWGYKAQAPSIRHLGPTAQDFRAAFGLGEDSRHIDTIDSEGVALAAIQGLYRQNQALQRENRTLRAQLSAQNARLTRLEHAFAAQSR